MLALELVKPGGTDPSPEAAKAIAAGFDMLRVDFYEHDGVLWFGELTPYPGSGLAVVDPAMDAALGERWTLPRTWRVHAR